MKANIREIIYFLRNLGNEQLRSWDGRDTIRAKLKDLGAEYLAAGAYSYAYKVGKFVIKIASQDLSYLQGKTNHPLFKKYAPTIYWMHTSGRALVCKFVKYVREKNDKLHDAAEARLAKLMRAAGFEPDDLHKGNLVRVNNRRWCIIDYGCWVGNY